jgi:predicted GNAT family N-acyltransferase
MAMDFLSTRVEPLADHHKKTDFSCGIESLDKYLQLHACQDIKRSVAATFVMTTRKKIDHILGYYTLSSTAIDPGELEASVRKRLPPYPLIPATLIGRLARDKRHKGLGVGEYLLMDALNRCFQHSREIASFAVVVDAIDDRAYSWYADKWGFIAFQARKDRLYLPMKTIEKLMPK